MRPLLAALLMAAPLAMAQQPVVSTPESQQGVSLTIYNQGFGVVREVRTIPLQRGANVVRFEGVAQQIDPTSLAFKSLTDPDGVTVREQNYQFDLIGANSVLDKAVGQRIRITRRLPGGDVEVVEGVLLSQPGQGLIVQLDDGRVLVNPEGTVELMSLPPGLVSRPSLLWQLNADRAADHRTEVSYMTNGITWEATYVAVISADETKVDLTGWVTLTNQSGATYRDASLQLLAGEVRRVQDEYERPMYDVAVMQARAAAPAPAFQEEEFFEYHLYTLEGQTTIAQNETKQMTLLAAPNAGVRRQLLFDGGNVYGYWNYRRPRPGSGGATDEQNAAIVLELENSEANGMGMPLPKGKVRVYKADARGNLQFLGEDRIDHTARNEKVRLYIGDAFDVVGTRRQVRENRISDRVVERTFEIEVRNRKTTPATVDVVERIYGDWTITQKSQDYTEIDAFTISFPVSLQPDETKTVTYTVRTQW